MMALSLQCKILRALPKNLFGGPVSVQCIKNGFTSFCTHQGSQRLLSTKPSTTTPEASNQASQPAPNSKDIFITVYRMPYITHLAVLNKTKLHQTVFTAVTTSISSVLSYTGHLPDGCGWTVGAIGFMICSFLYSLGFFCSNVVGFVYINDENSLVRISFVNQWGRRIDHEFHMNDLVPLSELPRHFFSPLYFKLRRYSQQETGGLYKLNICYAQITDRDRFNNLFGKVEN